VYDCLYLALAQRERGHLVTADQRFLGGLAATGHAEFVYHLSDLGLALDAD
jgi:predicted nucleic acid-binding protein